MEFELAKQSAHRQHYRQKPVHQSEPGTELGKTQPQDIEFEEAVLGAIMLEKDAYAAVSELLIPESFYLRANQLIYAAIRDLSIQQQPIDLLTVTQQLRSSGNLEEAGGAVHISELTTRVASAANIEYHAQIVAQKYLARELISFSSQIGTLAFDESLDVYDLMQEAEGKLFELSRNTLKREVVQIDPIINEALNKMQEAGQQNNGLSGLPSGFRDLDKITSGWQRSDLIIIAARPAMGKTALVLSMAKNMTVDFNVPVAIFSLEMSNLQLVNRLISNVCNVRSEKIKNGDFRDDEWQDLMKRIRALYSAPLYVDDTPSLSVFELRTKARRLVKEHNVQMIIIDYLQLMNASGMKFGSREQEVSTISRSLKQLAKELNIPIIALSQLNRNVESRGNDDKNGKRPQLSDLRESGSIEQDADIVCFIHRPAYYTKSAFDKDNKDIRDLAEFIIAKHRSGSVGDVNLRFVGQYARFENRDDNANFGSQTYESKITGDDDGATPKPVTDISSDGFTPPPPNAEFLAPTSEEKPPF
ncbi:MAG: replicative DNA helicase [Sodaliphilus sp.]